MSALPNFLIIGAGSCGTTSLYHYLKQHPQIFMSPQKETRFFHSSGPLGSRMYIISGTLFKSKRGKLYDG